jgi:hypothetical protein
LVIADGGIIMTTEKHGSLLYRATAPHDLEADEISFAISRFLPKAETSEEFAYIRALEARYVQLTGQQWRGTAWDDGITRTMAALIG